jgi:hypothetical protein
MYCQNSEINPCQLDCAYKVGKVCKLGEWEEMSSVVACDPKTCECGVFNAPLIEENEESESEENNMKTTNDLHSILIKHFELSPKAPINGAKWATAYQKLIDCIYDLSDLGIFLGLDSNTIIDELDKIDSIKE